jgi:hypothetical protein
MKGTLTLKRDGGIGIKKPSPPARVLPSGGMAMRAEDGH